MLRPVAAGLMCLGLAALGAAVSRGQDESPPARADFTEDVKTEAVDVVTDVAAGVVESPVAEGAGGGSVIVVDREVSQDGAAGAGPVHRVEFDGGDVVISTDDGKIVEKRRINFTPLNRVARLPGGPQIVDPQTRESLEKLTAGLKEEVKKLEAEGRIDEAARKMQSIQVLEQVLSGRSIGVFGGRLHATGPGALHDTVNPEPQEIKKLHARRDELAAQLEKADGLNDEAAAKLKKELQALDQSIAAQRKLRWIHQGPAGVLAMQPPAAGQPVMHPGMMPPGAPGMGAGMRPMMTPGMPGAMGGMGAMMPGMPQGPGAQFGVAHAKSEALSRQAAALSQAAEQLTAAGLSEQAHQLADQAEKLRAKAQHIAREEEQMRAQGHAGGIVAFGGGGPPAELHRSIAELHEQVQLLRKEVAEVRELLQQRR